ncbi:helix-turn-helix transcriptional regulator [Vagococcus fluvialis]|nr:helix-turn-helix transcriptional regulator [Vagococcus fluvialis]NKD49831.1 helix-turn-helix transcriptional regulator [Vagococcus fluvialis]
MENNKRKISLETLIKLLDALEISIRDFFIPYSENEDEELKIL